MRVKGETKGLAEKEDLLSHVQSMHESNPMMGLRGVRLSIVMPEIVEMQVRAIFEAAANQALQGVVVKPEVMIPLTGTVKELNWIQPRLERIAKQVMEEKKVNFSYKFGTMIEIPRAAVTASEIAGMAEFFSFGTNDLTQMTFGYSRDDAERNFLVTYVEHGILPKNPFQTLDRDGVGRLMKMAIEDGRQTRVDLEVGICGEHGGDPASVEFCHIIGNNYVSCSPFRVPIARLAAAHAAIQIPQKLKHYNLRPANSSLPALDDQTTSAVASEVVFFINHRLLQSNPAPPKTSAGRVKRTVHNDYSPACAVHLPGFPDYRLPFDDRKPSGARDIPARFRIPENRLGKYKKTIGCAGSTRLTPHPGAARVLARCTGAQ